MSWLKVYTNQALTCTSEKLKAKYDEEVAQKPRGTFDCRLHWTRNEMLT